MARALTRPEAAERLGCTVRYLDKLRSLGEGPVYFRLQDSPNARVLYDSEDLEAWISKRKKAAA